MNLDLRPMSTSQLLDRTFSLYRQNFVLFAGIAALPPALAFLGQTGVLVLPVLWKGAGAPSASSIVAAILGGLALLMLYLIGYALATGAGIYAVSNAHLGKSITISDAYKTVNNRIMPILFTLALSFLAVSGIVIVGVIVAAIAGITGSQGPAFGLLMIPFVIAGVVLLPWLSLRLSIVVPACVLEKLGPVESLKRSFSLTRGAVSRIFMIFLLSGAIAFALVMAFSIPFLIAGAVAGKQQPSLAMMIGEQFANFLAGVLTTPISIIALSLVYYDQRVRNEAFDLTLMMEAIGQAPPLKAMGTSAGSPNSIG